MMVMMWSPCWRRWSMSNPTRTSPHPGIIVPIVARICWAVHVVVVAVCVCWNGCCSHCWCSCNNRCCHNRSCRHNRCCCYHCRWCRHYHWRCGRSIHGSANQSTDETSRESSPESVMMVMSTHYWQTCQYRQRYNCYGFLVHCFFLPSCVFISIYIPRGMLFHSGFRLVCPWKS